MDHLSSDIVYNLMITTASQDLVTTNLSFHTRNKRQQLAHECTQHLASKWQTPTQPPYSTALIVNPSSAYVFNANFLNSQYTIQQRRRLQDSNLSNQLFRSHSWPPTLIFNSPPDFSLRDAKYDVSP
ncbi:hypothetical protein E4U47_000992 [Claviceps purpurea]|nr:hypothetical protein E4U47_000992 [Claviceps purpurea]